MSAQPGSRDVAARAQDGERLRVLVVDDHDVVHWGFRLMLGELEWVERCLSARTGDEALDLTRRHAPDVALVDLFLGDESGPDVCERLLTERPELRVLLISGAGRISAATAAACGASGFIPKDWPAADVARAVRMVALGIPLFEEAAPSGTADPAHRPRARRARARRGRRDEPRDRRRAAPLAAHGQGAHERASIASSTSATARRRSSGRSASACCPEGDRCKGTPGHRVHPPVGGKGLIDVTDCGAADA